MLPELSVLYIIYKYYIPRWLEEDHKDEEDGQLQGSLTSQIPQPHHSPSLSPCGSSKRKAMKTVTFKNPIKDHSSTSHTPTVHSSTQPKSADSHPLKSPSLCPSIKHPACVSVQPWARCCLRSHRMWPCLKYPVPAHPQRMAWLPQASPEDYLILLGCPTWAVHRGLYSSEGTLHLHPSRALQQNPCWPPQCSPGDWKKWRHQPKKQCIGLA